MPYAANDKISTLSFDGAIEITDEQYSIAAGAIADGMRLVVNNNELLFLSTEKIKVYSIVDGSEIEAYSDEKLPDGYTDKKRPDDNYEWNGQQWVKPIEKYKSELVAKIDNLVAEIYQRFSRFQSEYELRESEAIAFRANGYEGDVPRQVAAFANRAGLPAQQATDLILSQAAGLRAALAELGDLRMRKYEVMKAQSEGTAQTIFDDIKTLIEQVGNSIS